MTNFFEVECSVDDNNSVLEIIQYDTNDIIIQQGIAVLPADFVNIVDGEIINFLDAGSGISLVPSSTGLLVSVSGINSSFISDFNEAVDDRIGQDLLIAGDNININYDDENNTLTITALIPQFSDTYALLSGANFTGDITAPSLDAGMVYVNGVAVSVTGHNHVIPDVDTLPSVLDNKLDIDDPIEGGFF